MKTYQEFITEGKQMTSLRVAAMNGMGPHTKIAARIGDDVEYFHPKEGEKRSGRIVDKSKTGYSVEDDETGHTHDFKFYDKKAHALMSESLTEAHDVELKPHENGTHYIVHKVHPKSGIDSDQLKAGEKLSDSEVDDLKDMYKVKIHAK